MEYNQGQGAYEMTDALKSEMSEETAVGMLEQLANGVAVFRGMLDGHMKPIFCNQRLAELLGISKERFFEHMSAENGYCIHPDDFANAREVLSEAIQKGHSLRETFRLRTAKGRYRYVTVFANVHKADDGAFTLYCIFSDAQEGELQRHFQRNRRRQFTRRWAQAVESDTAYVLLDITRDMQLDRYVTHMPNDVNSEQLTVQNVLSEIANDIATREHRDSFIQSFSMETLLRDANEGMFVKDIRLPFKRVGRSARWFHLNSELSINPETSNLELFVTFTDVDNEVRLSNVVDRILENDYEYLFQIDVQSGNFTQIGKNNESGISQEDNGAVSYADSYVRAIRKLLPSEYWEEGAVALSLPRIIQELETSPVYNCIFPVILQDGRGDRICQWSCEYVDSTRSSIMVIRTNLSKVLEYGYDSMTGMYARKGFYQQVRNELNANPSRAYYLLELDFDNFKFVNEEHGYDEGNKLLRRFAMDLRRDAKQYGSMNCIGHLEADHFALLLPKNGGTTPEELYEKISMQISTYPNTDRIRLRMGVYDIVNPQLDVALMYDCAHLAHRYSKGSGVRHIEYYTDALRDKMLDEQLLASEVQNALDTEQFEVWFQPQVNHAGNGVLIGAEALVRWNHPKRGMIYPNVFIPMLERNGLIYELDKYVWRQTCKHICSFMKDGVVPLPISVNISRVDIMQSDFLEVIDAIVRGNYLPYGLLHLEITESAFTDNADRVVEVVKELIARGFTVAIDDFGSGYSSLSMLKSVPAHVLKLDMRFFHDKEDQLRNECIIESVIRMAKMLGMAVLAEGVEDREQADALLNVGCSYIQGYLYSKPLSYAQYVEYAKRKAEETRFEPKQSELERVEREREENYELFRSIISGTNDIILVADMRTHRLLYANRAAERYYGRTFDPLNIITCSEYCSQSEACEDCPSYGLEKGEKRERVYNDRGAHMKALYTRVDWNGHDAFVFYQSDISSEIRELEYADMLIRNIPGAMVAFAPDADGLPEARYISEQAKRVFKLAGIMKEIPGYEDFCNVIHEADRARIRAAVDESLKQRCRIHEDMRIVLQDGRIMWVEMMVNPVEDKKGCYQYYGIFNDITDRKNAQARADRLIQSIPSAMTIYEIDGNSMNRIFISDSAKRMLGAHENTHDKVDLDEIYRRIDALDEQRIRDITELAICDRAPFSVQFRLKGPGPAAQWVQLDSSPIEGDGNRLYYYSIYTDITAQKQLESNTNESAALLSIQETLNLGLQEAMRKETPEQSIDFIIGYMGMVLHAERTYVFEKNADGTDTNSFEWVAQGVSPEKENLQHVPESVTRPWYEQFKKNDNVIIHDVEMIKHEHPSIYSVLKAQNIRSLIVTPIFNKHGEPMGFVGLDNPPKGMLAYNSTLVQSLAFFIEAALKRRNLRREQLPLEY